ncbi:MAG: methyltransferase domain-containing protein [Bryobacteraceae bacterium]|nr:methyltransferase domain-containing protein [Bryobacteraceae bacterium]
MSNSWDAALYDDRHRFVSQYGSGLVELASPQAGERVLDLGCGTGLLLDELAATGATVVGLDASAPMVEKARAAYPRFELQVGDARDFHFAEPFDLVFSNATLHWIPDAAAVARSVARALRDGGRFVAEFGGERNCVLIVEALLQAGRERGLTLVSPFYYPSVAAYAQVLDGAGFEVTFAQMFPRFTKLSDPVTGLRDWIQMFCGAFLAGVPAGQHEEFLNRVEELTRPQLHRDGNWYADYRRLRVVAVKRSSL